MGWFADVVGIPGTGPIQPFLPIMVFAILFGLSMDYHVFLVSRMQEEWGHTGDNRTAVRRGLAASGRVVATAAAIMISVFAAFTLGDDSTIKLFGLALATAVLFDAFVVRLIIVPSLMYELRRANWWLPRRLGCLLPTVVVESEEEVALVDAEIADVPDALEAPRARSWSAGVRPGGRGRGLAEPRGRKQPRSTRAAVQHRASGRGPRAARRFTTSAHGRPPGHPGRSRDARMG